MFLPSTLISLWKAEFISQNISLRNYQDKCCHRKPSVDEVDLGVWLESSTHGEVRCSHLHGIAYMGQGRYKHHGRGKKGHVSDSVEPGDKQFIMTMCTVRTTFSPALLAPGHT